MQAAFASRGVLHRMKMQTVETRVLSAEIRLLKRKVRTKVMKCQEQLSVMSQETTGCARF